MEPHASARQQASASAASRAVWSSPNMDSSEWLSVRPRTSMRESSARRELTVFSGSSSASNERKAASVSADSGSMERRSLR